MGTRSLRVDPAASGRRLDVFLVCALDGEYSRRTVQRWIRAGDVRIDGDAVKAHRLVAPGEVVEVRIPEPVHPTLRPEPLPIEILFEDDALLVLDKPAGMMVHPAPGKTRGTLVNALLHHGGPLSHLPADDPTHPLREEDMRPGIVHRLDRETSGVLLVAKTDAAHRDLAGQFERRLVRKKYLAVVEGEVASDEGRIEVPLGRHPRHWDRKAVSFEKDAKEAVTEYRVLRRGAGRTLLALFPRSGRTHQLRVHLAYLRHPIVGDAKYGRARGGTGMRLHAQAIGFRHPSCGKAMRFSVPPPAGFFDAL